MEMILLFMRACIVIALVSHVVLWNFMELRNKKPIGQNNVNTSRPGASSEETQPPCDDASNDTSATPPPRSKRRKKDGEGSSSKSNSFCRFCKQTFTSPQALGGHMNRHRGEREKEEFQKAEILIHTKGQNFASGYSSGGAHSYYQSEGNRGNHYQGGGIQVANASVMGNMSGGGLQRQVHQNSNQQFVGAPQLNPNYGNHQQTTQAHYQTQLQHGGSYANYNQGDNNAPGRPHVPSGVPQTSYTPRANSGQQYEAQGTGTLRDVRPYAMPYGSSSTGVAHHQSNTGFTSHNLSQAAGGASTHTLNNIATFNGTPAGSNSNAGLRQSTSNQSIAQFVDQRGNTVIQGPSSGYPIGLRPLNASHFHDNLQAAVQYDQGLPQDHFAGQASYAGTSVHGTNQVQSDQYDASVGMENQYNASVVGMLNFEDAHEGDEFGNVSTIAVTESGHGDGAPTGRYDKMK